jgi:hypothetical protein
MAFDFILMLTENDRTIADARARLDEALEGGVRHIGFKDVGLPVADLRAPCPRRSGRPGGGPTWRSSASMPTARWHPPAPPSISMSMCLLGGTRAEKVTDITRHHPVRYYPFPGRITGHPSVLEGPASDIVASARALAALEHVHGLDLLAYRYTGDVPAPDDRCEHGGRETGHRRRQHRQRDEGRGRGRAAGAQGFTVGTAALAGAFPAETGDFAGQVRAILAITARAQEPYRPPRAGSLWWLMTRGRPI